MSISSNLSFHRTPENFETAMKLAVQIAKSEMFSKRIGEDPGELDINFIHKDHVVLSVNIPDLPPEEIKGVKVCPLSYRVYDEWFQKKPNDEGRFGYHYSGAPKVVGEAEADESDIVANWLGYATITPLCFDLTKRSDIEALRQIGWGK